MTARIDARQRGEAEYFTGRPCKWGHVAPRRTDSGACKQCLRHVPLTPQEQDVPYAPPVPPPPDPVLVQMGMYVMERDYVNLRTIVWDSVRARHPRATQSQVFGRGVPKLMAGGVLFIKPNVDPTDLDMLRQIKDALWSASYRCAARSPADEMRAQAMRKQLEEQAENHRFQPDEWKFT